MSLEKDQSPNRIELVLEHTNPVFVVLGIVGALVATYFQRYEFFVVLVPLLLSGLMRRELVIDRGETFSIRKYLAGWKTSETRHSLKSTKAVRLVTKKPPFFRFTVSVGSGGPGTHGGRRSPTYHVRLVYQDDQEQEIWSSTDKKEAVEFMKLVRPYLLGKAKKEAV